MKPTLPPEINCKGCWIYENRGQYATLFDELFEGDGQWDYKTCYFACDKRFNLKKEYSRQRNLARYYERKEEGKG